ncbi:NAD(P)/FAD-dependent oxidoreductase [Kitasatospora sp. NPDC088134]|uniref:NAD(P)/FAD-dependent oxidoreductase n=1 Tax=Kitasatospora sp. NPDC088134 TaxID=3364071 RepID=UPI0038261C8A
MTSPGRAVGDRGTAVVIGGGIAGCLAAWALRGTASRIVLVERDRYPERPDFRPGVPQARHGHLLLEAGHRVLEELMPGTRDELLAAGATRVPTGDALDWVTAAGRLAACPSDLAFLSCTRTVLDHLVLRRVRGEPAIEVLEGTEAVGLLGGRPAVTGVRVRDRGSADAEVRELPADLVVDATGRGTRAERWFEELGAPAVPTERVDAGVAYASRFYRRPAGHPGRPLALYVQTRAPEHGRFAVVLPVEDDRWLLSVGGMRGFEPALHGEEFEQQLGLLRDPALAAALDGAVPVGPARGFLPGPGVWRHYERSAPAGFLALGDASCTFNPVYGQGLTVAALGARALRDAVRQHGDLGPAAVRACRQAVAAATRTPWTMAAAEDVRFPATTGGPSGALVRVQHRFLDRVLARATTDGRVAGAFQRVAAMVEPPTALFRPSVLGPVLFGG